VFSLSGADGGRACGACEERRDVLQMLGHFAFVWMWVLREKLLEPGVGVAAGGLALNSGGRCAMILWGTNIPGSKKASKTAERQPEPEEGEKP